ncbi:MAG: hypothetical protein KAY50_02205 [Chitinophagaceae bacterium]|nr:hypothetical protein [Chitinophagaceae bacterium]
MIKLITKYNQTQIPLKSFSKSLCSSVLLFLSLILISFNAVSQDSYAIAKARIIKTLKLRYIDKAYTQNIDRFYSITCDSLIKKKVTIDNKPIKDILVRLFDICYNKLNAKAVTLLRIPSINRDFILTVKTYKSASIVNLYRNINVTKSNLLQYVFDGLLLGDSIKTINGLREMLHDPYYISSSIMLPQYAAYKDTLLYALANGAPDILIKKLAVNDTAYTRLVNNSTSKSVSAISRIKMDEYYERALPFSLAIYENRITEDSIKKLILVPQDYYHAFVDETIRLHTSTDAETRSFLKQPIADLNRKIANHYFIKAINDLHESPDHVRFVSINALRVTDLYFLLVAGRNELVIGGSEALYTSSFLYVFKKFLQEADKEGPDKFFEDIAYYGFDEFISNISDYALVDELVNSLNEEKVALLFGKYLAGLPNKQLTDNEIIINAMTMAEVLYEIRHHQVIKNSLIAEIDKIQKQPWVQNTFMYQRMYGGLIDILHDKDEYSSDISYDVLQVQRLQKQDNMVQACFFYDDDDAASSFASSIATYDGKLWEKKDLGNYIVFNSRSGNNMQVYMNKPNTKQGCDSSQNEMLACIAGEGYTVTSFIHRGHSYHLGQSLRKMTASGQFVFLGSCGGYSQVLKVFELNPDVNIIATRSVGSKLINDPLLHSINTELVNNRDINWNAFWKEFDTKFQSKQTKDLFSAYIPPNKYIGVKFIRKVFNY